LCLDRVISVTPDIRLGDLSVGTVLGSGGEGEVFALDGRPNQVFKRYIADEIDEDALRAIIEFPSTLSAENRQLLLGMTTWPTHRVTEGARVVGLTMPTIPPRFLARTGGRRQQPRELQYLMFQPTGFWGDIQPLDTGERIVFLRQFAGLVRLLHLHQAVIGDLSQANVLWSEGPSPRVLLIDCDAVRLAGHGTVCKPKETPDWTDPTLDAGAPDLPSDQYKVAALIMRVLSVNAYTEPPHPDVALLPDVPYEVATAVRTLYVAAGGPRTERPTVEVWERALRGLSDTYATPPVVRLPTPQLDLLTNVPRPVITLRRSTADDGSSR
jgi:hypothetical protein